MSERTGYIYPSDYCSEPTHRALAAHSPQTLDALLIAEAPLLRDDYLTYALRRAQGEVTAELRDVLYMLAVALDPSDDEEHRWCDEDGGGSHRFDRESFERDARNAVATPLLSTDTVGAADEAPFVRESGAPGETRTHDL